MLLFSVTSVDLWRSCLLWLLLTLALAWNTPTQANAAQDSTVIAALALNFARFTEWPANILRDSESKINLCVFGDNVIQQAFDEIHEKPVGNKKLNVINLSRPKNLEQCHLLYFSDLDRSTSIQILTAISNYRILTIGGDDRNFLKDGGMVYLEIVDGTVKIQINLNAVKQAGLQISSRVLKLSTIVAY